VTLFLAYDLGSPSGEFSFDFDYDSSSPDCPNAMLGPNQPVGLSAGKVINKRSNAAQRNQPSSSPSVATVSLSAATMTGTAMSSAIRSWCFTHPPMMLLQLRPAFLCHLASCCLQHCWRSTLSFDSCEVSERHSDRAFRHLASLVNIILLHLQEPRTASAPQQVRRGTRPELGRSNLLRMRRWQTERW